MIAFLHTNEVHVSRFEELVKKVDSQIETKHFVNKDLLDTALNTGKTDTPTFIAEIDKIKRESPDMIICTCSTYGGECDNIPGLERIDRPIATEIVTKFHTIGLAYTAESTKQTSLDLLTKISKANSKSSVINEIDCTDLWEYFETSNFEKYEEEIAKRISRDGKDSDVIFLAQASMEKAKNHLKEFKKPIVSSSEFGIMKLLEELRNRNELQ